MAEGFELAEQQLIQSASHGESTGTRSATASRRRTRDRRALRSTERRITRRRPRRKTATSDAANRAREGDEMTDSFGARSTMEVSGREYEIHRLDALQARFDVARLPYSLKVLLENVSPARGRRRGHRRRRRDDRDLGRQGRAERGDPLPAGPRPDAGLHRRPRRRRPRGDARRDGRARRRPARRSTRSSPVDLVIDHSVQVDAFGNARAFAVNAEREFERNQERYEFLRWGQKAFDNFRVVPPATGICHQVNLEYLGQVVCVRRARTASPAPTPTRSSAPTRTRR